MRLTLEQIVEETRSWSPEQVGELVDRLTEEVLVQDSGVQVAWEREIGRRLEEIQSGKVRGIPAEEVFAMSKRILDSETD